MGAISEVSPDQGGRADGWRSEVIDFAMQIHGGGGLTDDFPLAAAWTAARALRLADGPDEVHLGRDRAAGAA